MDRTDACMPPPISRQTQPAQRLRAVDTPRDRVHLRLGALLLVVALLAFGALALALGQASWIGERDLYLAPRLQQFTQNHRLLRDACLVLAALHSTVGALALTALAGYLLLRRGARAWALTLALAVPSAMLLNVLIKHVFTRPRPVFAEPIVQLASWSFPSGHTLTASVLYGVLACYVLRRVAAGPARRMLLLGAGSMVLLVGASRVFLGVHYLSDVLAGLAEGCAWTLLCIGAMLLWQRVAAARAGAATDADADATAG